MRRAVPVLVLSVIAMVAAVVCGFALVAAGPMNPVSGWFGPAEMGFVSTKSQYESMLASVHVAAVAAVVTVVAAVAAVVLALVVRRRRARA
ncbi:hypothetical protein [Curtobacterium aurantiacum]|uniref:Uncharacterized protein n=1 Tax=Curtobacterium aurantiacum TaxID=3236919 RepID=A0ABS5VC04_9MICO|nr:hypothetical protein [Curtobacterium flaccumfaciens]MBT1543738.1 hypothetical protein [Curtobacterium flaccumfaciens pv. flaccumfaciens]MBT1586617.1 hypothetical protein [Curtobacterium flaccumfaciens pv. flaccumfaciens]